MHGLGHSRSIMVGHIHSKERTTLAIASCLGQPPRTCPPQGASSRRSPATGVFAIDAVSFAKLVDSEHSSAHLRWQALISPALRSFYEITFLPVDQNSRISLYNRGTVKLNFTVINCTMWAGTVRQKTNKTKNNSDLIEQSG